MYYTAMVYVYLRQSVLSQKQWQDTACISLTQVNMTFTKQRFSIHLTIYINIILKTCIC